MPLTSSIMIFMALLLNGAIDQQVHGFVEVKQQHRFWAAISSSSPSEPSLFSRFATTTPSTEESSSSEISDSLKVRVVRQMPEPLPLELKNQYYLLRHGQSTANVASIISSSRSLAYTDKHGLTPTGYQQGKESAQQLVDILKETSERQEEVIFVSSPFARARETAQACLDGLQEMKGEIDSELGLRISTDIVLKDGLVERYFGKLDAEAIYTYSYVWPLDKFNVTHTAFDVESVAAVCSRIRNVVMDMEDEYGDEGGKKHIVFVSHADTLQISKLYAARAENVGLFSSYRFKNGEIRRMILGCTKHFPEPEPLLKPKRDIAEILKDLEAT